MCSPHSVIYMLLIIKQSDISILPFMLMTTMMSVKLIMMSIRSNTLLYIQIRIWLYSELKLGKILFLYLIHSHIHMSLHLN